MSITKPLLGPGMCVFKTFNPQVNCERDGYPGISEEEREAQRGQVIC